MPRAEHSDRDIADRSTMSSTLPPLTKLGISANPKLTSSSHGNYYYGRCHAGSKRSSSISVAKATVSVGSPPPPLVRPEPEKDKLTFEDVETLYIAGKDSHSGNDSAGQSEECAVPKDVSNLPIRTKTHLELDDGKKVIKICKHASIGYAEDSQEVKVALFASKIGVGPLVHGYGFKESGKEGSDAYSYIIMEKIQLSLSQYILNCTQAVTILKQRMLIYDDEQVDRRNRKFGQTDAASSMLSFPMDHNVVATDIQVNISKLWNGLVDRSFRGCMHLDLHVNNVMLRTSALVDDQSTVVFIDYGDVLTRTTPLAEQLGTVNEEGHKVIDMGKSGDSNRTLDLTNTDDECALMMKTGFLNNGTAVSDNIDAFFIALKALEKPASSLVQTWKKEKQISQVGTEGAGVEEAAEVVAMFLGKEPEGESKFLGGPKGRENFKAWLAARGWNADQQATAIPQMESAIVAIETVYYAYQRGMKKAAVVEADGDKAAGKEAKVTQGLTFDADYFMSYMPGEAQTLTEADRIPNDSRNAIVLDLDEVYIWSPSE